MARSDYSAQPLRHGPTDNKHTHTHTHTYTDSYTHTLTQITVMLADEAHGESLADGCEYAMHGRIFKCVQRGRCGQGGVHYCAHPVYIYPSTPTQSHITVAH